jgi:hypothetical protein
MITVEEMKYHMPGWTATVEPRGNRGIEFRLWAPSDDRDDWAASWDAYDVDDPKAEHPMIVDGTEASDFRRGDSMEEALTAFASYPDPDLAARARRLLSGAARAHAAENE